MKNQMRLENRSSPNENGLFILSLLLGMAKVENDNNLQTLAQRFPILPLGSSKKAN